MMRPRLIPCLLLSGGGLVKTVRFRNPRYVGDPINAVKIFNEKEVDELIFLDIEATVQRRPPPFEIIAQIASECFMPVCFGGGIKSVDEIRQVLSLGIEKVCISSQAVRNPDFINQAARIFGSQSIIVCIDVRKKLFGGYEVVINNGKEPVGTDPVTFAQLMQEKGAGELVINSVDRDGTLSGYDYVLINSVTDKVSIPVVACGGAGRLADMHKVIRQSRAHAAAAGSFFVFHGKHRAVLINYPQQRELEEFFL